MEVKFERKILHLDKQMILLVADLRLKVVRCSEKKNRKSESNSPWQALRVNIVV